MVRSLVRALLYPLPSVTNVVDTPLCVVVLPDGPDNDFALGLIEGAGPMTATTAGSDMDSFASSGVSNAPGDNESRLMGDITHAGSSNFTEGYRGKLFPSPSQSSRGRC